MKKIAGMISCCMLFACCSRAQGTAGRLQFEQGKTYTITVITEDTMIQQAAGRAIDFFAKGTAVHSYQVRASSAGSTTLHHRLQSLSFQFDGMNQKRTFDSDTSREGALRELLNKQYDLTIDASGKVIRTEPANIEKVIPDENSVMIAGMLEDIISLAYPPANNEKSFFKILPDYAIAAGDSWTDSLATENEKWVTVYTLAAVTDTEILIDYKTNASSSNMADIMGRSSTTKLKTTANGRIILDKATGILKEKTSYSQSSGSKEVMGASLPINEKSASVIRVKAE